MNYSSVAYLGVIGLFVGLLLMLALGQYLGRRNTPTEKDSARAGLTTVEAAVFGLLG